MIIDPYFPDAVKELIIYQSPEPLNIVISGGFLATFLSLPQWPSNNYKIWVLCHKAKEVLLQFCGLPSSKIGVIPRYVLFPLPENHRELNLNMPLQLVYGGRLGRNKGLLNLISLTQELQVQWGLPVELHLFGEFFDVLNLSFPKLPMRPTEFKKMVTDLIQKPAWMMPPEIKTNLSADEWLSQAPTNPVFINLSQLSHEDFGVSLAQAQSAGWPAILSSWGAHWDTQADNTLLLPRFDLQWGPQPLRAQQKKLAQALLDGISDRPKAAVLQNSSPAPEVITPFEMKKYIAIAEKKYSGVTAAARMGLRNLLGTSVGKKLFQDYNKIFSNPPSLVASSPQRPHKRL